MAEGPPGGPLTAAARTALAEAAAALQAELDVVQLTGGGLGGRPRLWLGVGVLGVRGLWVAGGIGTGGSVAWLRRWVQVRAGQRVWVSPQVAALFLGVRFLAALLGLLWVVPAGCPSGAPCRACGCLSRVGLLVVWLFGCRG